MHRAIKKAIRACAASTSQAVAFIVEYQRQKAIAPTVRKIARHLGLSSPGGIHRILTLLKDRGYLQADALKKRSWRAQVGGLAVGGIPVIGDIAAGDPIEALAHVQEKLEISPSVSNDEIGAASYLLIILRLIVDIWCFNFRSFWSLAFM